MMLIERVMPLVVGGKSTLQHRLIEAALQLGLSTDEARALVHRVPLRLLNCDCFLDKITSRWRYEFGSPYELGNQLLWGTNMWPLVDNLCWVLREVDRVLTERQRREYHLRLSDIEHHQDTLVEFVPLFRMSGGSQPEYETRSGRGNRTVDGAIPTSGARVLLDVKHRDRDFIEQLSRVAAGERDRDGTAPAPTHNHEILFRNVEDKYTAADPSVQLQGVWIVPGIQQEQTDFETAFRALDSALVHFAVLGGWESSIHIVTARTEDRERLFKMFPQVDGGSSVFERCEGTRGG
jgi:hypothetical protein